MMMALAPVKRKKSSLFYRMKPETIHRLKSIFFFFSPQNPISCYPSLVSFVPFTHSTVIFHKAFFISIFSLYLLMTKKPTEKKRRWALKGNRNFDAIDTRRNFKSISN